MKKRSLVIIWNAKRWETKNILKNAGETAGMRREKSLFSPAQAGISGTCNSSLSLSLARMPRIAMKREENRGMFIVLLLPTFL